MIARPGDDRTGQTGAAREWMGARTIQAAGNEDFVTGKNWSLERCAGFSRRPGQRLSLLSDAAAMGAGATAETALKASACPAPN